MSKRTSAVLVLLSLVAAFTLMLPAAAHHSDEHGKSDEQSAQDEEHGKSAEHGQPADESSEQPSDHDGDADSDSSTTDEDGHESEAEASSGSSDNQHPSGNDRSAEYGGSGGQGQAESNPDDTQGPTRYEGQWGDDKSGGPGGNDVEDQDGNNGCGNDDDFDDDNNGWCGQSAVASESTEGSEEGSVEGEVHGEGQVHGSSIQKNPADSTVHGFGAPGSTNGSPEDEVLGVTYSAPAQQRGALGAIHAPDILGTTMAAGAELPFTGSEIFPFALAGLLLIATGWGLWKLESLQS